MPDAPHAPRRPVHGIGGWLLLYVIQTSIGIFVMTVLSVADLLMNLKTPELFPSVFILTILVVSWNIVYGVFLCHLVRLRRGAVVRIREMLIGTQLFYTLLPFIFSGLLTISIPGAQFSQIVLAAYDRSTITSLIGAAVMTAIWHRYFCVSRRVRNTWPEEDRSTGGGESA